MARVTALQAHGEGLGAKRLGEYRGATAAACFSDPQQELRAMRAACGVYDLGYRAKISLTGDDRIRWLNGMVTNNIRDLAAGSGVYAFLLNPQGHILGDLYAYNRGESITVDTDVSQVEKILATFDHYIIMDDVEVTNLAEHLTAIGLAGPSARTVLRSIGLEIAEVPPLQLHDVQCECDCGCVQCTIVRGEDTPEESFEIWLAPAQVRALWDAAVKADATPVGFEALEMRRVLAGIPQYGVDIRERDLPQETGQDRALNFNKGCYIGQEIVERIRSRGAVHRGFAGFLLEGTASIAGGTKIRSGDKDVGEITSTTAVGTSGGEKSVALGYIRPEFIVPGRQVQIGDAKGTVISFPFDEHSQTSEPALGQRRA